MADEKKDSKYTPAATIVAAVSVLFIPANVILEGWILSTLWKWFVVPIGAPAIHLATACGLCTIASFVQFAPYYDPDKKYDGMQMFATSFYKILVRPMLFLGIGYIIHAVST